MTITPMKIVVSDLPRQEVVKHMGEDALLLHPADLITPCTWVTAKDEVHILLRANNLLTTPGLTAWISSLPMKTSIANHTPDPPCPTCLAKAEKAEALKKLIEEIDAGWVE